VPSCLYRALFLRDVWGPDEARYAQIAREMVQSGQWILPHLNYEVYADKPPLLFWLIALSATLLGGFSTFAVVLPSALAGTGTVVLVYYLARDMFGNRRTAFLAGIILATTGEFLHLSRFGRIDMVLCFFETLSAFCFWRWYREEKRVFLLPFYIGMAFAVLAKGPVGLLPLPVAILFLVTSGQYSRVRRIGLLPGLIGIAALVACWLAPAAVLGGQTYWKEILGLQIFGRIHGSWSHRKPFYFYLQNFGADSLPWFVLLPGAVTKYFRDASERSTAQTRFVVTWFLTIFIFFTVMSGKRNVYILPLYPAYALFAAKYLCDLISARERRRVELKAYLALLFIAALGAAVALPIVHSPFRLPENNVLFVIAASFSGVLGIFGLISLRARTFRPALIGVSCLLAGILSADLFVVSSANGYTSARPLGEKIRQTRKGTEQVGVYGSYRAEYSFFTGLQIEKLDGREQLRTFLDQPAGAFCIVEKRRLSELDGSLPEGTVSLGRFIVKSKEVVLLDNAADENVNRIG